MKKVLLMSAALGLAACISGASLAGNGPPGGDPNPGGQTGHGKPDCDGVSPDGTPGGWIAANVQELLGSDTAPGSVVSGIAQGDGGAGDDVQGGLATCGLGSQVPD